MPKYTEHNGQIFAFTDGTDDNTFDVLAEFGLEAWPRSIQTMKGGGVWQDSPLSDGRSLVDLRYGNVIEIYTLSIYAGDGNVLASKIARMRDVLLLARGYWLAPKKRKPVYLVYKGCGETIARYAVIANFETPEDKDVLRQMGGIGSGGYALSIERWGWRRYPPGQSECIEMLRQVLIQDAPESFFEFPLDASNASRAYTAALDLTSIDFAIDGWFYWPSRDLPVYGSPEYPTLIWCSDDVLTSNGFQLFFTYDSLGLRKLTLRIGKNDGFLNDAYEVLEWNFDLPLDEWFHLQITRDENGGGSSSGRAFLNGSYVISYSAANPPGYLFYNNPTTNFKLGNNLLNTESLTMRSTWVRIRNIAANIGDASIVVPDRCVYPTPDVNTLALWQYEQGDATTLKDRDAPAYDLAMNSMTTGVTCDEVDEDNSYSDCEAQIIGNGNAPGIQWIFNYDASLASWSANLCGQSDFSIFPDPSAIGDEFYIGSIAPLNALTFNIVRACVGILINFFYYNAGWLSLSALAEWDDETNSFQNSGINHIYWGNPTQTKVTINGINAYWIRFQVAAGGPHVSPLNGTDRITASERNYILTDRLGGDIGVDAELNITPKMDYENLYRLTTLRMIAGLRDMELYPDFRSALNFSDTWVGVDGATATAVSGLASFVDSPIRAPSGRAISYTALAGATNITVGRITIPATISNQFKGRFKIFLRAYAANTGGALVVGTFTLSLYIKTLGYYQRLGDPVITYAPEGVIVYEFDVIELPISDTGLLDELIPLIEFSVAAVCNINGTLELIDLHLMPSDEMYLDTFHQNDVGSYFDTLLQVGSIQTLTRNVMSQVYNVDRTALIDLWEYFCQRRYAVNSQRKQGLFFLFYNSYPTNLAVDVNVFSYPKSFYLVNMNGNKVYLSAISEDRK